MRFYFSKTTIQYHAIRHKEDNEHREDGTCLAYAGSELSFLLNYLMDLYGLVNFNDDTVLQDAVQETIEFDGGNGTYPSCGRMALFTITFFDKTSAFSKNVLIGTDADGVPIDESVLREILFLPVSRSSEASSADFEGLKKLYEERKPQIVQKARKEQNDTLYFEIGRIRQRAEDKKRELAAEIETLTWEIESMKKKGTTKHEQAFVNSQSAADLKARLMKLKQDAFMTKMTLNNQVQQQIKKLEKSITVSLYERTAFIVQFAVMVQIILPAHVFPPADRRGEEITVPVILAVVKCFLYCVHFLTS